MNTDKKNLRETHLNTFRAGEILDKGFKKDVKTLTRYVNNIRESFGHEPVTDLTVLRYCNAGQGYEQGPPEWFATIMNGLYEVSFR